MSWTLAIRIFRVSRVSRIAELGRFSQRDSASIILSDGPIPSAEGEMVMET